MNAKMIKGFAIAGLLATSQVQAADYVIDSAGAHASIEFRISHLGTSWLVGRFNDFKGDFTYDSANPNASSINVDIKTASIDSNHAERDKHLRSGDFLSVSDYPDASFKSKEIKFNGNGSGTMTGDLTLHGVTKEVEVKIAKVGEGEDPWGGYRAGFTGTAELKLKDFGINYNLGPASETVYLDLNVEGKRK